MRFAAVLKVIHEGGSIRNAEGHLEISAANSVTILFGNATSFRNYHDISGDAVAAAEGYLQHAMRRSFEQLRRATRAGFPFSFFACGAAAWAKIIQRTRQTGGSAVLQKTRTRACSHCTLSLAATC